MSRPSNSAPVVTAFGNQKGGVGKTTTCLGVADALARAGRAVLVVDLDPQANATAKLRAPDAPPPAHTVLDALMAAQSATGTIQAAIEPSTWHDIDVAPSPGRDLARFDHAHIELAPEGRLRKALAYDGGLPYDHILLDMPPALARLTFNGLTAAHQVIVVTEAQADSLAGVSEFLRSIREVQASVNTSLHLAGVAVTDYGSTLVEHQAALEELTSALPGLILTPLIPRRTVMSAVASTRRPISEQPGAAAVELAGLYDQLAEHLTLVGAR